MADPLPKLHEIEDIHQLVVAQGGAIQGLNAKITKLDAKVDRLSVETKEAMASLDTQIRALDAKIDSTIDRVAKLIAERDIAQAAALDARLSEHLDRIGKLIREESRLHQNGG